MESEDKQTANPEQNEKKQQLLRLYEQCLRTDQRDMLKAVDLSLLTSEEKKAIQLRIFRDQLLETKNVHSEDSIRKLQQKFEVPDEILQETLKEYCLSFERLRVQESRNTSFSSESKRNFYEKWHGWVLPEVFELPEKFGFTISEDERKDTRIDGFLSFIGHRLENLSSEELHRIALVCGLGETPFEEEKIKKFLVDYFLGQLEKTDPGWRETTLFQADYFPKELLQAPENQLRLDTLFGAMVSRHFKDGIIITEKDSSEREGYYTFGQALGHYEKFGVSTEALKKPTTHDAITHYVDTYFEDAEGKQIPSFGVSQDVLGRTEISLKSYVEKAQHCLLKAIEAGSLQKISSLKKLELLDREFLESPEVSSRVVAYVQKHVNEEDVYQVISILEFLPLPNEVLKSGDVRTLKQNVLLTALPNQSVQRCEKLLAQLDFSDNAEFFSGPELRAVLIGILDQHIGAVVKSIRANQYYFDQMTKGDDARNIYRNNIKGLVAFEEASRKAYLMSHGELVDEVFGQAFRTALANRPVPTRENWRDFENQYAEIMSLGVGTQEKLFQVFGLSPELTRLIPAEYLNNNVGLEEVVDDMHSYTLKALCANASDLKKNQEHFGFSSEQMRSIARKSFEHIVEKQSGVHLRVWVKAAQEIATAFGLQKEDIEDCVRVLYATYSGRGWDEDALALTKEFPEVPIDNKELEGRIQNDLEGRFIKALTANNHHLIKEIIDGGILGKSFYEREDIQNELYRVVVDQLNKEHYDYVRDLVARLPMALSVVRIIQQNPRAVEFITHLGERFPRLATKYQSSLDAYISACELIRNKGLFTALEQYPFLAQALEANDQYALKLVGKFGSLDKLSRSNIEALYGFKNDIATTQNFDSDSPEFRIAMQQHLMGYRRNDEIASSMRKHGIDMAAWLDYQEEKYFDLGKEATSASEQMGAAIVRLGESVDAFSASYKEILGEYQKELSEHKVPVVDLEELRAKLESLRINHKQALQESKTKEAQGMEKAIASLERQIENPKTVSAWHRFLGDIQRLTVLKEDFTKSSDELQEKEKQLGLLEQGAGPREKRKETQRLKGEIKRKKADIYKKTLKLLTQIDSIKDKLGGWLTPVVGVERMQALTQELAERVSEPLDHCVTDFKTVHGLIGETKSEELEGSAIRVALWDRNPDVDLYLGNYTDCCIRIDSEHMASESTIADYLTDVGMQVVTMYDENKNIPVAAAWCWIGMDDNDRVALVVDNVEANTNYSTKHRNQMQQTLKDYIEQYAKAIGIPHVAQGQANNDLVIATMDSAYFKVGGFNRPSGYYLEGEDSHGAGGDGENNDFDEHDWDDDHANNDVDENHDDINDDE